MINNENTKTNKSIEASLKDKQHFLRLKKLSNINKNPVMWAKTFVTTIDNKTKKKVPWTARWYQAEMLLDKSLKKVARCGRRTGDHVIAFVTLINCWDVLYYI